MLELIEILSAVIGVILAALLPIFPRFGPASWMLSLFLVPAFLSCSAFTVARLLGLPPSDSILFSFAGLLLSGAGGCLTSYTLEREDYIGHVKKNRWFFAILGGAAPALVALLYWTRPALELTSRVPDTVVLLGPFGYYAALYLLLVCVIGLANIEQTLRSAEEHVRWEIKFLLLGLALSFGAMLYVASNILLYTPHDSFLSGESIQIFPVIFLCSGLLILQSWRRGTGRSRVVVSQGIVYSTITLLTIGVYLVMASFIARWVSQWTDSGIPIGPIILLLSAITLLIILLGTAFRHRVRRWVRRNLFVGRYDYRQVWMDATERIRSIDSPRASAAALADLIHKALGSLDISVWLADHNSKGMRRVAARGTISDVLPVETQGLLDKLAGLVEPVPVNEIDVSSLSEWPSEFLEQTRASLLVPLISSGRVIGLLTVGADRSGEPFDQEAREFLRVVAIHSASEFHKSVLLATLVEAREAEAFQTFSTFLLHDLKNFASTLSLIAKNAARHHGNPDFQLDAFHSILETADKMKRLCNGLRTFSTKLPANRQMEDLNHVVRNVAESFEVSLANRVQLELGTVPSILLDVKEFDRVLQNLILNAHEASPEGPIRLSTGYDSRGVIISVTDNGKGIPQEFLETELFQPFHTTKRDGLGIGLFQSKKIVESHEGSIEVESREGEGTVVRIILPIPGQKSDSATETVHGSQPDSLLA